MANDRDRQVVRHIAPRFPGRSVGTVARAFALTLVPALLAAPPTMAQAQAPATPSAPSDQAPAPAPAVPAAATAPTWPVSGIYTAPETKDLGALTGLSWLKGTKVRGWVDGFYEYNANSPDRAMEAANTASVIKAQNLTIEGRTFDVHDRSFTLSLAEIEVEKVPEIGGAGFKVDLAFGETQEIIVNTIRGRVGAAAPGDFVQEFDKVFQHASVSYVVPVGRGLRLDFGKFVTHIGGETIETVKNWNYSHAFFYTYAIPFQDTGLHVSYPWSDTFYTDVYVLNGWNTTIDNNRTPSIGASIGAVPVPWLSIYLNYLGGPEQPNNNSNLRHLADAQLFLGPLGPLNFLVNFDYGTEKNAIGGAQDATWWGVAGMVRYKVSEEIEPSVRLEYYDDADGFTTGTAQKLWEGTFTLNVKLGAAQSAGGLFLFRPEVRFDKSNKNFFSKNSALASTDSQFTVGAGLAYLF